MRCLSTGMQPETWDTAYVLPAASERWPEHYETTLPGDVVRAVAHGHRSLAGHVHLFFRDIELHRWHL